MSRGISKDEKKEKEPNDEKNEIKETIVTGPVPYTFVEVGSGIFKYEENDNWKNLPVWEKRKMEEKKDKNDTEKNVFLPVELARFEIGRYIVTFDDFDQFCNEMEIALPDDEGWGRGRRPVININWLQATQFCNWFSRKSSLKEAFDEAGNLIYENEGKKMVVNLGDKKITFDILQKIQGYRLPSEAEWEYAAKGGPNPNNYIYIGSNNVDEVAWYKDNTTYCTKEVGLKKPNSLGIYDLPGNVFEYCLDGSNIYRVLKGGGYPSRSESMRPSYSNGCRYDESHSYVGFRMARSLF